MTAGSERGRTWLIVGASSAVAKAFARQVAAEGAALILAGRDMDDLARTAADATLRGAAWAVAERCDLTDPTAAADLVRVAAARAPTGPLDVLLAAALMPDQAEMEADPARAAACLDATLTGPTRLLLTLAPELERRGAGRVVILGSVAGDRGRRRNHVYGAAKAGLAALASGLRARLWPAGVSVTLVKPGVLDTAMTWGLPAGPLPLGSPEACAAACRAAARRGRAIVYVPGWWRLVMLIIRLLPDPVFKRVRF